MQPRAICFDAVGTLLHPEPDAATAYQAAASRHSLELSRAEIRRRFSAAFRKQEELDRATGWITSESRERQRWRAIVAEVLAGVGDLESCFAELYDHFGRPSAWKLAPATGSVLAELARRGFLLGLASNYDQRLHAVLAGFPELRRLQFVVISSEVGWRKPAPEFFAAVSHRTQLPAAAHLFVGDDLENDYLGAQAAGLHALLLDQTDGVVPSPPVRCICSLEELLQMTCSEAPRAC